MDAENVLSLSHAELLTGDYPAPAPVIEGLIDAGETSLWSAIFGAGKSITALAAARAVASGGTFLCHLPATQGTVLYVDAENAAGGIAERVKALQRAHPIPPDVPLRFEFVSRLALDDPGSLAWLDARLSDERPALLILDSWIRFLGNVNENDAGAVAALNGNLRALSRHHGCAVLILDHVRKSAAGGVDTPEHRTRGSGEKGGFVANLLALEPTREDGALLATCAKRRYGPKLAPFVVTRTTDPDTGALTLGYRDADAGAAGAAPGEIIAAIESVKEQQGSDASTSTLIAGWLGWSEPTTRKALNRLLALGFVSTRAARPPHGKGRSRIVYDVKPRADS